MDTPSKTFEEVLGPVSRAAVPGGWVYYNAVGGMAFVPSPPDISEEVARLNGILDDVRRVLKMELKAIGDSILDEVPDLHPADAIEKHLVEGLLRISPAETLREAMLANRLGAWARDLQAGKNAGATNWPIEELIRQVERFLNEPNPVLEELHDTIAEAFDAFKVQTQDEDGGPLDEPEYYVPNAKRAFEGLSAVVEALTRPDERKPRAEAERLAACGSIWYLVQYHDGIEYVYDQPPQVGNPKVKSFRKINGIELSTRYNKLSYGRGVGTDAARC